VNSVVVGGVFSVAVLVVVELEAWVGGEVVIAPSEQDLGHFSPQMLPTEKFAGRAGTVEVASPSQLPTISSKRKQSVICPPDAEASAPGSMSWQWSLRQFA